MSMTMAPAGVAVRTPSAPVEDLLDVGRVGQHRDDDGGRASRVRGSRRGRRPFSSSLPWGPRLRLTAISGYPWLEVTSHGPAHHPKSNKANVFLHILGLDCRYGFVIGTAQGFVYNQI